MLLMIVLVVAMVKYTYSNWPITLLAEYGNKGNLVDIKCVAYNISDDSALTWVRTIKNADNLNAIRRIVSSKFKPFENFEGTSTHVEWIKNKWKITDSNSHPLHFVTDHRWEDFPINNEPKNYKLQNNSLNIGLSLLSNNDFNIILSNGRQNFRLKRCRLSISYCKFMPLPCLHVPLNCTNKKELFSYSIMWMHINILWRDGNLLIEGNDNVCRADGIKFDEQINVTLEVIGKLVLWKTHDYKFLWTDIKEDSIQIDYGDPILSSELKPFWSDIKQNNMEQIGPIISNKLQKYYILMYVALCENCTMHISVHDNGKFLDECNNEAGKQNVKDGKYIWKRLKMKISGATDIKIFIKRQKTDDVSNGFWAIDDIRFGDLTEFQVANATVNKKYLREWQCHKLNNFTRVKFMNQTSTVNNGNVSQLCPLIYDNKKYCEQIKICNFGSNVGQCYCAPGYKGEECDQGPDEPQLFNCILENDALVLTWEHPTISNDPIKKFVIDFNALRSEKTNASFSIEIPVTEIQKTYSYEIRNFMNATEYNVGIYGVNKFIGRSSNKTVISPPPIPHFQETPVLTCGSKICVLKLGPIHNSISTNSFFWIALNSNSKEVIATKKFHQSNRYENYTEAILNRLNITEKKRWKLLGMKLIESNGPIDYSQTININESIVMNKSPLLIHVVLLNDYIGILRMKVYSFTYPSVSEMDSSGLHWYIILVTILIIVGIWFIKYTTATKSRQNGNRSTNLSLQAANIPLMNLAIENEYIYPCLIQRKNFEEYLVKCSQSKELEKQFNLLPKKALKPCHYGRNENNLFKNRMGDIIPYDDTRVILEKLNNDDFSDYINASFIDGYKTSRAYIAAQAPRLATINDFWRMIWQENIKTIVMLTNVTEGDNKKCEQYWPQLKNTKEYGAITIENSKEETFANYVRRILVVSKEKENFEVEHFHFFAWPHHDVPKYYQSLVSFVNKIFNQPLRIVVHCSAGGDRTGTILLCLYNLAMVNDTQTLQFFETVRKFRHQRPDMVNSLTQYKLAHLLVHEILFGVNTELPCDDKFNAAVDRAITQKLIKTQMKYLNSIDWKNQMLKSNPSTIIENRVKNKNRFQDIVPGEDSCISLKSNGDGSDYINAVSVDQLERKFIVTQQPLPETVGDFWKMVFLNDVTIIVSLNTLNLTDPTSCNFWPDCENEKIQPIPSVAINFIGKNRNDAFTITTCSIKKYINEVVYISKTVTIISAHDWPPTKKIPKTVDRILLILEKLDDFCKTISPIIVTCYDGATASGLFVALSAITERIKVDKICDVCQAVQSVRYNRQQFVRDEDQLKFLYKAALNYFLDRRIYSRIETLTR